MIGHTKSGQYLKNIARAILKRYCPPHKARGIHDFILATKSSVWIIMIFIMYNTNPSNTPDKTLYRLIACCLIHFLWR